MRLDHVGQNDLGSCHVRVPFLSQRVWFGSIPRQIAHEFHRKLDPTCQLLIILDTLRLDGYPILDRPAGDVEYPNVRLPHCRFTLVGAETGDESVLPDSDKHVAVNEDAPSLISS